jgi:hypothetical protein
LCASTIFGIGKCDVFGEKKACEKSNGKYNQEGANVRTYCNNMQINNLLVENKIVTDEIQRNIEHCITTPCCCVPKRFFGNQRLKRYIKKIYGLEYEYPYALCHIRHRSDVFVVKFIFILGMITG